MLRRILVVDDNLINRETLKGTLHKDYEIIEAENGAEALEVLQRNYKTLSAVLLDISMPVMDGYEVLRRMRDNVALSQIPVIVVTGTEDENGRIKALSLGANDFITKPYNPHLVKHCLRNNIALRETASIVNAIQRDRLTGLYTRDTFFEKAGELIKGRAPGYYTMACFDVDNFKLINDQYGTVAGDQMLQKMGRMAKEDVSAMGGIVGRVSADNFVSLFPTEMSCERFQSRMKSIKMPNPGHQPVSFSIGRYVVVDPDLEPSAIYDRAFIAKQSVKGRYDKHVAYFDETMLDKLLKDQQIIADMDAALAQHQFEVWFQPQYNHATGALIGAEALTRWRHPKNGLIPPNEFIPVFEQNGFIYELDKYMWEATCALIRKWIDRGHEPVPVSVNISRYDVFRADLIDNIMGYVNKYCIPVELLRLEITESAFARSDQQMISVVKQLIEKGFIVEIDDFGSGYSSLNTLKDVPAQVMKLDMKFFDKAEDSQRSGNIVESVVRMAKWLGMAVIAEGVENIRQADYLKSIGCYYIQGYLYAKPMPEKEYEKLCLKAEKEPTLSRLKTVDTLDNNAFWDPESMETLIFNSYVGGANIFEYHNGKTEVLRYNDRYAKIFSGHFAYDFAGHGEDPLEYLDDENRRLLFSNIQKAIETGEESTCEVCLRAEGAVMYLRVTVRLIARATDRYLFYCTVTDITKLRTAQQKERETSEKLRAIMNNVDGGITATVVDGGNIRLLLSNDKYYEILGYTRAQYKAEVKDLYDLIHPEDREELRKISAESYITGKPMMAEYRVIRRDGSMRWVSARLSNTTFEGIDANIQLGAFDDITESKLAEQRLRETDEQLRFLNVMAHDILAQPNSSKAIEDTLRGLLEYFAGNRAYAFEFDYEAKTASNTYEVCADGVSEEIHNLQNLPFSMLSFWMHAFDGQDYVSIVDVDALDAKRPEKKLLQNQNIKSLIAVPLKREGRIIGFVGVDDATRQQNQVGRLAAIGDYIAVLITRRDLTAKVESEKGIVQDLMGNTPGGFVRMQVKPDGTIIPVFCNEGFDRLVGMCREDVRKIFLKNVINGVHPDDKEFLLQSVAKMISTGEMHNTKCRIRHGSEGYIWVLVTGRIIQSGTGETFINAYYTDATEQHKAEEAQKNLLDNLPCGAALYEYDGEKANVIHLNRHYWELVGRKPVDYKESFALDAVYPADRTMIAQEIDSAIRQSREISCDFRVINGDGEYRPFHMAGRFQKRNDGVYLLFISYTPISEETMSFQEMLPVALSTMMSASNDLSYVKDKSLRYICCSRSVADIMDFESERDIIGKTDYDLFENSIADMFAADDNKILKNGQALVDYTEVITAKDGCVMLANTSKYPLLDTNGNVIGIYGVSKDVTVQREKESQLELLTGSIPGGLASFLFEKDCTCLLYCNDEFFSFSGYSREEYMAITANDPYAMIYEDDKAKVMAILMSALDGKNNGEIDECVFRCRAKNEKYRWFSLKGRTAVDDAGRHILNVVQYDITDQKTAEENLRQSREEYRIAIRQSGNVICRFNIAERSLELMQEVADKFAIPVLSENLPYSTVEKGEIAIESQNDYIDFYQRIICGEKEGSVVFQRKMPLGLRWMYAHFSTIFDEDEKPVSAIISFRDVTEQTEKEAIYNKWQQSLEEKAKDSYTMFICDLSKDASFDSVEGSLLSIKFDSSVGASFNDHSLEYASQFVCVEDRQNYIATINSDRLLANFYRGKHSDCIEYREIVTGDTVRWLKCTVELIQHPNSKAVLAYLMFEDIDEIKRAELQTKERAETDSLTGLLNRKTFTENVNTVLSAQSGRQRCGLMMMDVDAFKQINDKFGHTAGDQVLIDVGRALQSVLRKRDLVCRLGGDEFVIFLSGIPDRNVIEQKARRIIKTIRKSNDGGIPVSISIGIAVSPDDGASFEELYRKSDVALYSVKKSGKDNYAFYSDDME